jgi:hypothetical protein
LKIIKERLPVTPYDAPCPNCKGTNSQQVGFTWWGGVIGPKLLNHVKCQGCGTAYNSKTGKSNSTGIAIYMGVVAVATLVLLTVVFALGAFR